MVNMLSLTVTVLLLCFLRPCYCLDTIPVLVVDTGGISVMGANVGNPFNKITKETFSDMVKVIVEHASVTLIFIESELSIENISKKNAQGSPFKAFLEEMINEKKLLYLPSVIDPYSTLTSLFPMSDENTYDVGTAKQIAKDLKPSSHVYIKFNPEEPSVETLRLHDLAMRNIVRSCKSSTGGSIVVFYTAVKNPQVIAKKLSPKVKKVDDKSVLVASKRVLFRLSVEFEHKGERDMKPVEVPVVKHERETLSRNVGGDDLLSTTLAFPAGFHLKFNFMLRSKDWILDKITLLESDVEVGHAMIGIGAPLRSSYHCAETLRIVNSRDQSAVILKRYQWQPSRESCELTKKGCKDKNVERSRFKLPIGTVKDIKIKKSHKIKPNVDDEYLDEKDIWGHKKKPNPKLYDTEALFEAESSLKANQEAKNGSISSIKHKHKPEYIVEDDNDEDKANEESVLNQKKHVGSKNTDTATPKYKANEDPSGQKKHAENTNAFDANGKHKNPSNKHKIVDDTLDSQNDHESNTASEKDLFGHNQQNNNTGKNPLGKKKQQNIAEIDSVDQNKQQSNAEKDPFSQKKQPHATDAEHKTNKQKEKGQSNNDKSSKNEGVFDRIVNSDESKKYNVNYKFKKPGHEQKGVPAPPHSQSSNKQLKQSGSTTNDQSAVIGQSSDEQSAVAGSTSNDQSAVTGHTSNDQSAVTDQTTKEPSQSVVPSMPTSDLAFGTSVNCGPFFNHEVLSCLLITFIILGMFFYGLEMMVNLQANDRFDDFGGRTFSIAEEK